MAEPPECPIITKQRKTGRLVAITSTISDPIDVDLPFSAREVAAATSDAYVAALGRGDQPADRRTFDMEQHAHGAHLERTGQGTHQGAQHFLTVQFGGNLLHHVEQFQVGCLSTMQGNAR